MPGFLRATTLGTVAAGAMMFGYGRSAQAGPEACIPVGNFATCQGNQSAGIASGTDFTVPPVTTLNVNTLIQNIAPAAGVDGINFISNGDITIVSDTGPFAITTTDATGIYARSVGGGPGDGAVTVTQTGTVSTQGNASSAISVYATDGFATVTQTGAISTQGNGSDGINVFSSTGITVTQTGAISTQGTGSQGIYANSTTGNIRITLNGGSVTSAQSEGVRFGGAANNTLTINNAVTVSGGTLDVRGGVGNETIENFGTFTAPGDIDLGGGTNAFNNNDGAIFNSGTSVNLGAGNLFTNAGTLAPGGSGTVQTTVLTGNINQTASGILNSELDLTNGTADLVNVTGTANLSGNVLAQVVNPALGAQSSTILSATGGTTNNGLGLLASPALQASLSFPNANDVVLTTNIDFLAPGSGLNRNQTGLATNLNAILGSGGGTTGPVLLALLNGVQTVDGYLDGLNQLLPESYQNTETASLFAAERFNSNLLSCPKAGQGFTAVSQGQCMWVRYGGRWSDRDSTVQTVGYEEDTHGISGGGQVAVAPNWFVGVAVAYEDGDLDTDTNVSADTDRYMLGGVIKYQSGPVLMALAGSFGSGDVDMTRRIAIGGFNATARSSFDVDHVGATLHAAILVDRSSWYAKPFVDVNVTHIDRESAQESGGGAANLTLSGSDETYFSVTPALELGTTIDRGNGRAFRPYVRAGVTFNGDTDQSLSASFAGAPAAAGSFTTTSEFDDVFADIEAGVTFFRGDQHIISAGYEGRFSDDTDAHGFFVKGTRTF